MLSTTKELLDALNKERIIDIDEGIKRLRSVGLTEFALVTNEMQSNKWKHINYVPRVTSDDVQQAFTGSTGTTLLAQSIDFVRHFYSQVLTHLMPDVGKSIDNLKILDYGCGWGRLLRLLPYYFSYENILGVDPWDLALNECEKAGILSPVSIVERDASDLTDKKFDAGYAFSVFTHLPGDLSKEVLKNLSQSFSNNGIFIITIRPPEYWSFRVRTDQNGNKKGYKKALSTHAKNGFAYVPHGGVTGEYYGDASMTQEWFEANIPEWRIVDIERSLSDSLQVYWTLKKK